MLSLQKLTIIAKATMNTVLVEGQTVNYQATTFQDRVMDAMWTLSSNKSEHLVNWNTIKDSIGKGHYKIKMCEGIRDNMYPAFILE